MKNYVNSAGFAAEMDAQDELGEFRNQFYFPIINGKKAIYLRKFSRTST